MDTLISELAAEACICLVISLLSSRR